MTGNEPPRRVLEPLSAPQHFAPPSARELRAQAVQRLQTGLFGLAAILLIVGLADIINERALRGDGTNPAPIASATASAGAKGDPLADAGVVPSASASAEAKAGEAPGAARN